jgi:hypothetical protein
MSVQAINVASMNVPQLLPKFSNSQENTIQDNEYGKATSFSGKGGSSVALSKEYYSSDKMVLRYQNKDGDSVTLSTESVEYQRAMLAANGANSPEDWQKVVDFLKEQYESLKSGIIKGFLKGNGQEIQETDNTANSDEISGLPEYWNAENTSQRIVDFATSFLGVFKGSGDEFLSMIKDAVEKGFSLAKDTMGDLPDPVNKLVNNTHDLVMKKLDAWAGQQGIKVAENVETGEATAAA